MVHAKRFQPQTSCTLLLLNVHLTVVPMLQLVCLRPRILLLLLQETEVGNVDTLAKKFRTANCSFRHDRLHAKQKYNSSRAMASVDGNFAKSQNHVFARDN